MNLILEAQMLAEEESKNTLRMVDAARTAKILYDAGIPLDYENLAFYGNLSQADVQKLVRWSESDKRRAKLGFEIGAHAEPKGDFAKLLAGLLYISKHKQPGIQNVEQHSGLSAERIRELVAGHEAEIKKEFSTFGPHWIRDTREAAKLNAKRQSPTDKKALIRQAVMDISKGRPGTVTATQLQNWNQGAIGLDKRAIDRYLSDDPELRDLDKYRAVGKRTGMTDADREQRYWKELNK